MTSSSARRSLSIVGCGWEAIVSAISSARATWRPGSTTSLTRPISSASAARTSRPVSTRSSARPVPITRGSRCVPPSISGTPQRRSAQPSTAVSVAMRRSHQSASSRPPARHQPEIAARVGFDGVNRLKPIGPSGREATESSTSGVSSGPASAIAFRSAPAQNASGPSPVSTGTRASSSASNSRKPSRSSSAVSTSTALRRSRRSIVSTAAAPVLSYRTLDDVNRMPPGARLLRGRRAEPLQLPAESLLAALEPDLDQRQDGDQHREEAHDGEREEGDHLVIGTSPQADAVSGQRSGGEDPEHGEHRGADDEQSGWTTSTHGANSTSGRAAGRAQL